MDLERIKQNLRLRSGRLKKTRKTTGQASPAVSSRTPNPQSNAHIVARSSSQPPDTVTYSPVKEEPSIRNWDTNTALPDIPGRDTVNLPGHPSDPPRAAAQSDAKSNVSELSPIRYGRSGIERPRIGASPNPMKDPPPVQPTRSETETGAMLMSDTSDVLDFDLRPPAPRPKPPSIESVSEALFSEGYLNVILRQPECLARFTSFLAKYQPQSQTVLLRYLETQKAIKAIEYANAVAEGIGPAPADAGDLLADRPSTAATLDKAFEEWSTSAFRLLADTALPAYVTYNMVKVVSDCLISEITGKQTPLLRDMVRGLSEVFCLTDPKQEDNPIIYASSEFYRFTGYGPDDVIGRNCRFLQGPRTKRESVSRLRSSIQTGQEICETLLNYRRDGRPFLNLLLIAPLHDDQGNIKYYIGAQVDVTGLVERGRGLDGFERYIVMKEMERRGREITGNTAQVSPANLRKSKALAKLRDLSETFDMEETAVVRAHSRSASTAREDDEQSIGGSMKTPRRLLVESDDSSDEGEGGKDQEDETTWKLGQSGRIGPSGKLPGVYDSYMLIRPAPSLRVVFVSPRLRQRFGNILQHPFLSHVAAPSKTLVGLKESFGTGIPVSAKIHFMLNRGERRDGTQISPDNKPDEIGRSRLCWISATPLLGSDDSIGVWMVVVVDKTKASKTPRLEKGAETDPNQLSVAADKGRPTKISIPARCSPQERQQPRNKKTTNEDAPPEDVPIKPTRLDQGADLEDTTQSPPCLTDPGTKDNNGKIWTNHHEAEQVPEAQPHMEAHTEEYSDFLPTNTNHSTHDLDSPGASSGVFVRPTFQGHKSEELEQARVDADSDGEPDAPTTLELDSAIVHSLAGGQAEERTFTTDSPYNHGVQDGIDPFHGFSDNEDTPRRPQYLGRFDSRSDSPSRAGTSAMESSSTKSNSKPYMDYLLHPGSRASSEYNRPMSGSGLLSSMYHTDGVEHNPGDDDDDLNDEQCARTPYSVD